MGIFNFFKKKDAITGAPHELIDLERLKNCMQSLEGQLDNLIEKNDRIAESLKELGNAYSKEEDLLSANQRIFSGVSSALKLAQDSFSKDQATAYLVCKLLEGDDLESSECETLNELNVSLEGLANWEREIERNITACGKAVKESGLSANDKNFTKNICRDKTIVDFDREALLSELGDID